MFAGVFLVLFPVRVKQRSKRKPKKIRIVDHSSGREPPMCTRSPEGQSCPGLHQKQSGQQVKRGDSAPLLCCGETSPRVLHPALEPSAQEGRGAVGAGPEKGNKNDQKAGAPFL